MRSTLLALLALPLTLFASDPAPADLPAGLPAALQPEALQQDGFQALFNGKDLTGWRIHGGKAQYEVKDDAIHGFGEMVRENTFLCTEDTYRDFIFAFECKFLEKTGNSGCMFRAFLNGKRVTGYQCELDNWKDPQRLWTAGIYDEARRGWLDPTQQADDQKGKTFTQQGIDTFRWDDWNLIVIRCRGNHLETWLNGQKRADFHDTHPEHTTLEGFIGLQIHSGPKNSMLWRNLYLKELPEKP